MLFLGLLCLAYCGAIGWMGLVAWKSVNALRTLAVAKA
jgi:hypothetical protein